jgi:hypothetical protein
MGFVLAITLYSLVLQVVAGTKAAMASEGGFGVAGLNASVAVVLIGLALVLIVEALKALRRPAAAA